MTTTTAITLTREEAAYAYLASFTQDERVVIGGRGRSCDEAVIHLPLRCPPHSALLPSAYLVAKVSGNGGHATISAASLLSGRFHIEHDGQFQWNGEQTWFDADGYAAKTEA